MSSSGFFDLVVLISIFCLPYLLYFFHDILQLDTPIPPPTFDNNGGSGVGNNVVTVYLYFNNNTIESVGSESFNPSVDLIFNLN